MTYTCNDCVHNCKVTIPVKPVNCLIDSSMPNWEAIPTNRFFHAKGGVWEMPHEIYEEMNDKYIGIDKELDKITDWLDRNPRKKKTHEGMKRFILGWFKRGAERGTIEKRPDKTKEYESLLGAWLRAVDMDDLERNHGFIRRLQEKEFRKWAESVKPEIRRL